MFRLTSHSRSWWPGCWSAGAALHWPTPAVPPAPPDTQETASEDCCAPWGNDRKRTWFIDSPCKKKYNIYCTIWYITYWGWAWVPKHLKVTVMINHINNFNTSKIQLNNYMKTCQKGALLCNSVVLFVLNFKSVAAKALSALFGEE